MSTTEEAPPAVPCPKIHLALLAWSLLPLAVEVNPNLNVVVTASLAVLAGSWRSVKPDAMPLADRLSKQDAIKMPIVGSAVLFSLFIMFTFLPKNLVNLCLTAYFLLLGTFAVSGTFLPFVEPLFPKAMRERTFDYKIKKLPVVMNEDLDLSLSIPEIVSHCLSSVFCIWYCIQKHWYANNMLGLAFSVQGIEHLSLGSVQVGAIMLGGLFIYDIFWVFCTPVMVTVAKSFDAPIKLLFPRMDAGKRAFSMLGLGDIVVPGLFVALMLRYDVHHNKKSAKAGSSYFHSVFWGYVAGLAATIVVMNVFNAAQPALLYIVPTVLGSTSLHAAVKGEFMKVFRFEEEHPEEEEEEAEKTDKDAAEEKKAQ